MKLLHLQRQIVLSLIGGLILFGGAFGCSKKNSKKEPLTVAAPGESSSEDQSGSSSGELVVEPGTSKNLAFEYGGKTYKLCDGSMKKAKHQLMSNNMQFLIFQMQTLFCHDRGTQLTYDLARRGQDGKIVFNRNNLTKLVEFSNLYYLNRLSLGQSTEMAGHREEEGAPSKSVPESLESQIEDSLSEGATHPLRELVWVFGIPFDALEKFNGSSDILSSLFAKLDEWEVTQANLDQFFKPQMHDSDYLTDSYFVGSLSFYRPSGGRSFQFEIFPWGSFSKKSKSWITDLPVWQKIIGYKTKAPTVSLWLKNLLNVYIEQNIGEHQIINMILTNNLEALKIFSHVSNLNKLSANRNLPLGVKDNSGRELYSYGLSPLMIAALVKNVDAIDILKAVPGIDLELKSLAFGPNKTSFSFGSISASNFSFGSISSAQISSGNGGWSSGSGGGGSSSSGTSSSKKPSHKKTYCPGCSALMVAVKKGNCVEASRLMVENPEIVNQISGKKTALSLSIENNNNCLENLMKNHGDPSLFLDGNIEFVTWLSEGNFKLLSQITPEVAKKIKKKYSDPKNLLLKKVIRTVILNDYSNKENGSEKIKKTIELSFLDKKIVTQYLKDSTALLFEINRNGFRVLSNLEVDITEIPIHTSSSATFIDYVMGSQIRRNAYWSNGSRDSSFGDFAVDVFSYNSSWLNKWIVGESYFGYSPLVIALLWDDLELMQVFLNFADIDWSIQYTDAKCTLLECADALVPRFGGFSWERNTIFKLLKSQDHIDFPEYPEMHPPREENVERAFDKIKVLKMQ